MGLLIDGQWRDQWYDTKATQGHFVRKDSRFRNWIAPGDAEAGRYHLYVSYACPWAHRTLIMRALKGLKGEIGLSVVHWFMGESGWTFEPGDGVIPDPVMNAKYLHQIYTAADPKYTGRVTVPVLWDKKTGTIVNNESSEIIRILNSSFDGIGATPGDYYPADLRPEIDKINARIYDTVNNGVYKCGFATTQQAYESHFEPLFETLDWLERRLADQRYLMGRRFTEADIRLFTTLVRFDAVYYSHFKCNKKRLVDYPQLWGYTRDIYQNLEIGTTVHMEHIKGHYFMSHPTINPTRIVPLGPELNFMGPHSRDGM
jgi:putative glutathione S-transferase